MPLLVILFLLGARALLPGQGLVPGQGLELFSGAEWVDAERRLEIPDTGGPALLLVAGRSDGPSDSGKRGDLVLQLEEAPERRLRGEHGATHHRTWIEVPRGAARTLRIAPERGGLVLEAVTLYRATRIGLEVWQESPRRLIAARVIIEAMDGFEPPRFGRRLERGWWDGMRLCPAGRAEILLPANVPVTLSAAATSFHRPLTRQVRTVARGRQTVRFVLPWTPPPAAGEVIAPAAFAGWSLGAKAEVVDRILGIRRRDPRAPEFDAQRAARSPGVFVRRLLDASVLPPVLRIGQAHEPFPKTLRPLVSLRLPSGAMLHTNGPVLDLDAFLRRRDARRGSLAFGSARVVLGGAVRGGRLQIHAEDRKILDVPVASGDVVPLEFPHDRGTRLVALLRGERYAGADVLAPPPLCFRSFVLP